MTEKEKSKNEFIEALKKNIGREVVVVLFDRDGKTKELEGKCLAIEFAYKSIILQDKEKTYLIPRYLYLERKNETIK